MKEMILKNNRWYDENNNSWSATAETEESAMKKSKSLFNCDSCDSCDSCNSCDSCKFCSYCDSCKYYKENPQRYVTPKVGSRNKQTTIYWNTKDDIQVVCGCYKGNIAEFEQRVKDVHGDSEYGKAYMEQIKIFKMLTK